MATMFQSLRKVVGAASDLHSIASLAGAIFTGHDPAPETPIKVKGIAGIFGFRDEREFLELLNKLEKNHPGAQAYITQFCNWHYNAGAGAKWVERFYVRWKMNQFRAVIIDMAADVGKEKAAIKQTITAKRPRGTEVVTVIDRKTYHPNIDRGLDTLERMYFIISLAPTRQEGLRACLMYLRGAGVPTVEGDTAKKAQEFVDFTKAKAKAGWREAEANVRTTATQLKTINRRQRDNEPLRHKILNLMKGIRND